MELNAAVRALCPLPPRIATLPVSPSGWPVPWFVAWMDEAGEPMRWAGGRTPWTEGGRPDFRIVAPGKISTALVKNACWVCGQRLGVNLAFVIGPMCAINRVSSEPPSHLECARFAVVACPFLTQPRMRRNEKDLPEDACSAGGNAIKRNPGAVLVWVTRSYKRIADGQGGYLFEVGDPQLAEWYAEGRPATRAEVMHSINTGLPILEADCEREATPARREAARRELKKLTAGALELVP